MGRLKKAGPNSIPHLQIENAMTELKMDKAPRGIDQKTIIQHTLRFSIPMYYVKMNNNFMNLILNNMKKLNEIRMVTRDWGKEIINMEESFFFRITSEFT